MSGFIIVSANDPKYKGTNVYLGKKMGKKGFKPFWTHDSHQARVFETRRDANLVCSALSPPGEGHVTPQVRPAPVVEEEVDSEEENQVLTDLANISQRLFRIEEKLERLYVILKVRDNYDACEEDENDMRTKVEPDDDEEDGDD